MIRQCIHPNQKDWVSKLPAIEFAINSARSASTGYAPFFLNFGRMPRSMIWNDAPSEEFPAIREFTLQKKMAVMEAHNSILAAKVKQTWNANKKRQDVPFKTGDLVYLSSQNVKFPKGLARKLIPKFLGPYKILQEHGDGVSFKLEMPPHLKKRGMHDVFHSSLLRIHYPNDNHLFPGRMDTQIAGEDTLDDEWAVDRIKSHSGSKSEALFEILWKSGDTTWLPYYQITHLQALTDCMELIGVQKISKLPKGNGKPPTNDPQIFLGALDPYLYPDHSSSCLAIINPLNLFKPLIQSMVHRLLPRSLPINSPSIDLDDLIINMPPHRDRGVNHQSFTRISPTHYLVKNADSLLSYTVHVGQIADYLNFDEQLRTQGLRNLSSIPIAFDDFAYLWNTGASDNDTRRISRVYLPEGEEVPTVDLSQHPVKAKEFFITTEQVGLATARDGPPKDTFNDEVAQEFLRDVIEQRRNSRQGSSSSRATPFY